MVSQTSGPHWQARFHIPKINFMQLARNDPRHGLVSTRQGDLTQLFAWHVESGALTQLTYEPGGKPYGNIAPDGHYVYYLRDEMGDERGHYVRVPFAGRSVEDLTPDLPLYTSWWLAASRNGNLLAFILVDRTGYTLATLPLESDGRYGPVKTIYTTAHLADGLALSADGALVVIGTTDRTATPEYSLRVFATATSEVVGDLWDGPDTSINPVMFTPLPGDERLLATTNASGYTRPFLWQPRTGDRAPLSLEALKGDVQPLDWAADGNRILLCQTYEATEQLYVYHLADQTLQRLRHPDGTFTYLGGSYFAPNGEILTQWQDSTHPPCVTALDDRTGVATRAVLTAGERPPARPWRSIMFPTSDGQVVQGWLVVPDGPGPFPAVIDLHGGPYVAVTNNYSADSQMWVDHGFAFLTINYRGSTTFGRAFQTQIYGNPGHWEVEDLVAARHWLVEQHIADPDAVFPTGWSYGAYVTLLALSWHPDLWAGGLVGAAVADRRIQYEDGSGWQKGWLTALHGGTPEEQPLLYAAVSPITYADQIAAPLLIIQGRNDLRSAPRQMEAYEQKMKALGTPITVHWFEAGHGSASLEQTIGFLDMMRQFAQDVLRQRTSARIVPPNF